MGVRQLKQLALQSAEPQRGLGISAVLSGGSMGDWMKIFLFSFFFGFAH